MGPLTPQQRDKARRLDEILAIGVHVQDISLVNLDRPIFDRRLSCPTFARQWEGDAWAWVLPGQRVGIRYGRALVTVEDVTHQPAVPIGQKLPEYPHP
jgi:hypothetical protein